MNTFARVLAAVLISVHDLARLAAPVGLQLPPAGRLPPDGGDAGRRASGSAASRGTYKDFFDDRRPLFAEGCFDRNGIRRAARWVNEVQIHRHRPGR